MAAVPQEVAPVQSDALAEVVEFPLQPTTPFKLDIIHVNFPELPEPSEPIDPAVTRRSEIRNSVANHLAGVVAFGGLIYILESVSIDNPRAAVITGSLSFVGNALLMHKSFKIDRKNIEAKYQAATE